MLGSIIVKITFATSLFAMFAYFLHYRKQSEKILQLARMSYQISVVGIILSFSLLSYLIMTHQFQFHYVWNYSSTDLPTALLFSSSYAGQEGSFMLWAFFTGIVGIFLMNYAAKRNYETELMLVYSAIFTFLIGMLIAKNPFAYIWDVFPSELLRTGIVPPDVTNYIWLDKAKQLWAQYPVGGRGLNPLLQNYWMVIHPPILFIGFTSMSIPFSYAIAGMLKKDYVHWIRIATPWTVFGALALGTGIMLGGYWAYETLGWGGYWAWDPVENSSLVPWLVCVASLHTMLSQRKSGAFIKTNFILSILCFLLVLYSTFLTRSGVLGETSVHSFVEPGMWVYWLLLGMIGIFATIGFTVFFVRWKEMPVVPVEHSFVSREFALFLGAAALVFSSLFIAIGTSSPIITNILKNKISAVDTAYYVTTILPLGIAIALLAGIGQLLWWKNSKLQPFLQSLKIPIILSIIFTIVTYFIGATHFTMLIFIFSSSFALFANIAVGIKIFKGNPKMAGGAIAHIGLALMFLGFVGSAKYDDKETVSLEKGKTFESLGYTMKYIGYRSIERGRYAFDVEVEKEQQKFIVTPVMFEGQEEGNIIRNPDIINLLTKDFYLSPLSYDVVNPNEKEITLHTNEVLSLNDISIKYNGYDFISIKEGNSVNIKLDIIDKNKIRKLTPTMLNQKGNVTYQPAMDSVTGIQFTIKGMKPNKEDESKSTVTLSMIAPTNIQPVETLVVEASIKPFINVVWLGTFGVIVGFCITIVRRVQEAKKRS